MSGFDKERILLAWLAPDSFAIMESLTYTAKNGDMVMCRPIYKENADGTPFEMFFVSDLGSQPIITDTIVGDRCGKITLASIIHDWLFRVRQVSRNGVMVDIDEAYADNLLMEMCLDSACSESKAEAAATYCGVCAGGWWVWNQHPKLDLSTVDENYKGEDFVIL